MAKLRLPKTIGAAVDLCYKLQQERIATDRKVKDLKKQEQEAIEHCRGLANKAGVTAAKGKLGNFSMKTKRRANVTDWDAYWAWIKKGKGNARFAHLQKRPADSACIEVWDAGKKIPGVESFSYNSVTISKKGES